MPEYEKPYKTFDEQLALIEKRGLSIRDREFVTQGLVRLGYYRLSGYWYPFRVREQDHREGIDTPGDHIIPGHDLPPSLVQVKG
jgi:abortive infection bacteriophage resistance protein